VQVAPGTRFGPYEIVSLLGAGGMGEVYRARDTRLDRAVALKILPVAVSSTTMARERFEREARAISTLQHPNICALFDVGSAGGAEYIVMELLEGESLADRIARGRLPLDAVLHIGASIADALSKAHRAGIIHRDLKPGNIMLTKNGPKLLDFGLARRAQSSQPMIGLDAPTAVERPLTGDGMILGTLPYMAPEQLEARPGDARTDIFALGAVLYEMTTGRRAFQAESQASLLTKIMNEQPPAIETLQPVAPSSLNRLVMKCLAKDPDERWQTASDVADELLWIAEGGATLPAATVESKPPRAAWFAAAIATLVAIALAVVLLRRPAATQHTLRFTIELPAKTQFVMIPTWRTLAVSPNGQRVVFCLADDHGRRLWMRDLSHADAAPVDGTDGASSPFWSPDGRSIGFASGGKLKTVSLDSAGVQTVCDLTGAALSATWLPDGTIVYSEHNAGTGFFAVPAIGGTARPLFTPKNGTDAAGPTASGSTGAFFFSIVNGSTTDLWIGGIDGRAPRELLKDAGRAMYDPPYLLYVRDSTLFAQRFDEGKLWPTGKAVPVINGVFFIKAIGLSEADAAGNTLVYAVPAFSSTHPLDVVVGWKVEAERLLANH
jgi:hypothetical protein